MVQKNRGFTLIELLIVIAIIAILAGVVFVALDPLTRFQDSRDSSRWHDISEMMSAIKVDQVDNGGDYLGVIGGATAGQVYMIGTDVTGCDDYNGFCDTNVSSDTHCLDLSGLVSEGYLGEIPVSPNGAGSWTSGHSGYTLQRDSTGILWIRACESENTDEIYVAR